MSRISTTTTEEAKGATRFHLSHLPRLTTRTEHIKQLKYNSIHPQQKSTHRINCKCLNLLVGETGIEPATPCSQGRCATRLRYSPTKDELYSMEDVATQENKLPAHYYSLHSLAGVFLSAVVSN